MRVLATGVRDGEERQVSVRRLGSQDQTVMGLDEAIAAFKDEAVAPDLKRACMEVGARGARN